MSTTENSKSKHGEPDICRKTEDLIELNTSIGLWLKPISKINVSVALPCTKQTGQCIGTLAVAEKLKKRIKPYSFKNLKVLKSTLELIRFEAELESKSIMETVVAKLDRTTLKLNGFTELIKVKAAKVKLKSSRHEWETFFRDDSSMDETKPGLRADTIHLKNLPLKWFGGDKPKPQILLDVFQVFGDIRRYHIPCLDSTESTGDDQNKKDSDSGFKRFNFHEILTFDAFIMYRDYIGFVKAMDGLMAKKLVKKLDQIDKYLEYEFIVDFDKTKHLSDKSIKKRTLLRRYGLKDVKELKDFKEHAKKEKLRYEERFSLLKDRKNRAEKLFKLLLVEVEKQVKAKKEAEEAKREAERLVRKILEDEEKAREKLAEEKRYEMKRKHSSSSGQGLKSIAVSLSKELTCPKESNNNRHNLKSIAVPLYREESDRNNQRFDQDNRRYHHHHHHSNNHNQNHNNYTYNNRYNNHHGNNNSNNNFPSQSSYHHRSHSHSQNSNQQSSNHQQTITRSTRLDVPYQRDSSVRSVQRKLKRNRNLLVQVTWRNDDN
ncbi:A-kinase anchor protein 17A-like isoform X1 [Panonychus citri]|uniref:A-kinase anchor protein 17A-like isoform X1 n=1 Tax=Panonychus citri TaxID=50023 RepID=UPI002307EDF6|nr:A-kinase anchor protein 17A-like isoform X1 [Panonychus citri]